MILDKTENQSFWAPNFELLIIKNECGFSASHVPHVLFLSIRCPLCARSGLLCGKKKDDAPFRLRASLM